jgi:hypothetical protein
MGMTTPKGNGWTAQAVKNAQAKVESISYDISDA